MADMEHVNRGPSGQAPACPYPYINMSRPTQHRPVSHPDSSHGRSFSSWATPHSSNSANPPPFLRSTLTGAIELPRANAGGFSQQRMPPGPSFDHHHQASPGSSGPQAHSHPQQQQQQQQQQPPPPLPPYMPSLQPTGNMSFQDGQYPPSGGPPHPAMLGQSSTILRPSPSVYHPAPALNSRLNEASPPSNFSPHQASSSPLSLSVQPPHPHHPPSISQQQQQQQQQQQLPPPPSVRSHHQQSPLGQALQQPISHHLHGLGRPNNQASPYQGPSGPFIATESPSPMTSNPQLGLSQSQGFVAGHNHGTHQTTGPPRVSPNQANVPGPGYPSTLSDHARYLSYYHQMSQRQSNQPLPNASPHMWHDGNANLRRAEYLAGGENNSPLPSFHDSFSRSQSTTTGPTETRRRNGHARSGRRGFGRPAHSVLDRDRDSDEDLSSPVHPDLFVDSLGPNGLPRHDGPGDRHLRAAQFFRGSVSTKMVASASAISSMESVNIETLPESERNCIICYNEFGTDTPEGVREAPLRLPACKHVFGDHCIKKWFEESDSCPYCRTKVPAEPRFSTNNRAFIELVRSRGGSHSSVPHGVPPDIWFRFVPRDGADDQESSGTSRRSPPTDTPEPRRRIRPRYSGSMTSRPESLTNNRPYSYSGVPSPASHASQPRDRPTFGDHLAPRVPGRERDGSSLRTALGNGTSTQSQGPSGGHVTDNFQWAVSPLVAPAGRLPVPTMNGVPVQAQPPPPAPQDARTRENAEGPLPSIGQLLNHRDTGYNAAPINIQMGVDENQANAVDAGMDTPMPDRDSLP